MKFKPQKIFEYEPIKRFINSNIVAKTIAILICWSIALVPFYLYMLSRWLLNPTDFWQELAILVVAGVLIGWLQFILLFFVIIITIGLITDEF